MRQSRLYSFIESCFNILVGLIVAILAQLVIFPLYGMQVDMQQNLEIAGLFTIVSLGRSYLIRRLFNRI